MSLEEEISQQTFSNDHQKGVVNIIYTYSWTITRIKKFLKPFGLTPQQFNILRILRGQSPQPATINLLKDRMLDSMSDASRIVERLRQKKLVERKRSEKDRRCVAVKITSEGLNLLEQIDQKNEFFNQLLGNLSKKEAQTLNQLLDKLRS